jgi:hypothetical protein
MRIVKEKVSQKEKESRFDFFKKDKPKEKPYDGSVEVHVTDREYEMVIAAVRMSNKGYHAFVHEALKNFKSMQELSFPQVEDQNPKKWLTFEFEKEDKEALVSEAKKSGVDLKDFVRAIVWTASKEAIEVQKQKADRQRRVSAVKKGQHVGFVLRGNLLERYEEKHGQAKEHEVNELLLQLLDKHLK